MDVRRLVAVVAFAIVFSAGSALAQGKGKGKGKGKSRAPEAGAETAGNDFDLSFSVDDRRIIREWFANESNLEGLPPGLAKREELPPGLQKQLVKNGTLPPGLQKRLSPLPPDLERRLPRLPEDVGRVVLEGRVILMNRTTNRILDLIEDAVGTVEAIRR